MKILGLSFDYHDSAAAILADGVVVAAAEEERFSRWKHDNRFPNKAIKFCLELSGLTTSALDRIVFYENTLLKLSRITHSLVLEDHKCRSNFAYLMQTWNSAEKFFPKERISELVNVPIEQVSSVDHHEAHAASAFYCSPFEEAVVVTIDGVGEFETATISNGNASGIEKLFSINYPHSVGLFYSAFTAFLGFEVNEGEYKVMGLAAYGEPVFANKVRSLFRLLPNGSFELDQDYFQFDLPIALPFSPKLVDLFGPPCTPGSTFSFNFDTHDKTLDKLNTHYANIAASVQLCTEEIVVHMVRGAMENTGQTNICLAGGVALNSLANARIQRDLDCSLYVQPAAGDSGGAIGAAQSYYHKTAKRPVRQSLTNPYLGKAYVAKDIERVIERHRLKPRLFNSLEEIIDETARLLAKGNVVGWMQGRFEWGPRALGNRSILANPTISSMKGIVNEKIKNREPFRPFAPSVIEEQAGEYFDIPDGLVAESPQRFMLAVNNVRPEKKRLLPAVTHHDGTARVHLVSREANPLYYQLIEAFAEITNVPVLMNTSLNLNGEAIANSPYDAIQTFYWSGMDYLVIGNFMFDKNLTS